MIEEVRLINWKSFEDTTLYIEPLTAIIGCNASGKSNIFDALKFVSMLAIGLTINETSNKIRGGAEHLIKEGKESAIIEIKVLDDENNKYYIYKIEISDNNNGFLDFNDRVNVISNDGPIERTMPKLFERSCLSLLYGMEVDNLKFNNFVQKLRDIFLLDPMPQKMRDYSPLSISLNEDASNIAGVIASLDEERKNILQCRLTKLASLLPEKDIVEVWSEKVGRLGYDAMLYCKEKWTDDKENILDARSMSDGTLRFIAIITALLTRPVGSLLMVEEIDNGLHPSRVKDLVKALKEIGAERNIDILFTTHNPALIDALGPELLPCITYIKRNPETGSSEINTLDQNEDLFQIVSRGSVGDSMIEGRI